MVTKRDCATGPTVFLLHKATLLRLGDFADILNTWKHRWLGKIKRKRNTFKMKDKTSEKELNKLEISNLPVKEIK